MEKNDFDETISLIANITKEESVIVAGSQSLHGSYQNLSSKLKETKDLDVLTKEHREVNFKLGKNSEFAKAKKFHVDANSELLFEPLLPMGWKERLVDVEIKGIKTRCLDPNDLASSKLVAARTKDFEFIKEAIKDNLVDKNIVAERFERIPKVIDELPQWRYARLKMFNQINKELIKEKAENLKD